MPFSVLLFALLGVTAVGLRLLFGLVVLRWERLLRDPEKAAKGRLKNPFASGELTESLSFTILRLGAPAASVSLRRGDFGRAVRPGNGVRSV